MREAVRITGEREYFLIGSQAVHAATRRPPGEVLLSQECDLYPRNFVHAAQLLHSQLGRGSAFARRNGFFVDVVTPEIASLPEGWMKRLKPLRLGNGTAYCLDIHDLLVSKLAAGRIKDLEFAGAILKRKIANVSSLRRRINQLPESERANLQAQLNLVLARLD